ncbi:Endo-1-4-beta-xylanase A [Penicillium manginii]|uniref:Endo-1-4-beta-xylanase A n=1 Tax=Penicillium manginii TaxID=203109 RepID=UPI002549BDE9|nr:Endo-1-4-beta-xylanase A [Penicillium manginii]KAJ5742174.1 Endo-1-4-beta-xylanase A [Penicillium manginii]
MLSLKYFVSLVPALLGLTTPTLSKPVGTHERHAEILGNVTLNEGIERRSTAFSNSQDGVNAAGFYYSLYNDNKASAGYTEFPNSGEFQAERATRGGSPRSITWDGYFTASGDWTLAIYGWTTDPVTEWYIVESHGTGTPGNGNILGQVESDGSIYDVYSLSYDNVAEIYGVTSFKQYWSVRRTHRTTGTVNVAAHFNGWKKLGLAPGNPVFQMITLEGFEGQGYLNFTVQ